MGGSVHGEGLMCVRRGWCGEGLVCVRRAGVGRGWCVGECYITYVTVCT